MSIEIRELKIVGKIQQNSKQHVNGPSMDKDEIIKLKKEIEEICYKKVLRRLEKLKRR